MTDFKSADQLGQFEMFLICPVCDFEGIVYYNSKPPKYCSGACKQKAYRLRKQDAELHDTPSLGLLMGDFDNYDSKIMGHLEAINRLGGQDAAKAAIDLLKYALDKQREKYIDRV